MISHVAKTADVEEIHRFSQSIPELRVSATVEGMSIAELRTCIESEDSVFLVSYEDGVIVGFIYASIGDLDRGGDKSQACIVYLAVAPAYRKKGIAKDLYMVCDIELRRRGVKYVYAWADPASGVVEFMEKRGFKAGKTCVWMDREI